MYHFAICDDEQGECSKIMTLLERYRKTSPNCDFIIKSFFSIHALYDQIKAGSHFDLLLLDINMPDKTGIEAACELRKGGYEYPIIFLTTSREHAVDAFDVDAAQYLIKPVDQT